MSAISLGSCPVLPVNVVGWRSRPVPLMSCSARMPACSTSRAAVLECRAFRNAVQLKHCHGEYEARECGELHQAAMDFSDFVSDRVVPSLYRAFSAVAHGVSSLDALLHDGAPCPRRCSVGRDVGSFEGMVK